MILLNQRTLLVIVAVFLQAALARATEEDERPAEPVKIVFFVPSDLPVPVGTHERITKVADAAEAFLFNGMVRQGYPPATEALFQREADGQVEWLQVRGDEPAASGEYEDSGCVDFIIQKAVEQSHARKEGTVWWIFLYLGDQPKRFKPWEGRENTQDGGWAMVSYNADPGEILPNSSWTEGFNGEFMLKSVIHELGHALGLVHMGPDPTLGLGNSLMGPNPPEYTRRRYPHNDRTYLAASEAAMLWKHPLFRGGSISRSKPSDARWDANAAFDPEADTVTVSGKLVTDQPAHSVVLIDDRGDPDQYWSRSYAARLGPDGSFEIKVTHPATVNGHYRLLFCFENGAMIGIDDGGFRIAYHYKEGQFQFGK